jgi:single-stranded-DNA-specific exonuclease
VLVVGGDGWHRGVIGIVASKLVETFHRPAVVLSIDGEVAHGSCRSIPAFDMLGGLERCAHVLLKYGGHRQAAGISLESARVEEFRAAINEHADRCLGPDDLRPRLRIDSGLSFRGINEQVARELTSLAPFGMGNPRPIFETTNVEVIDGPRILKDRHLKMALRQDGRIFRAIAWRAAERESFYTEHRGSMSLAFSLEQNNYNGETYLELSIEDVKANGVASQPVVLPATPATQPIPDPASRLPNP